MSGPLGIITGMRSEAAIVEATCRYLPADVRPLTASVGGSSERAAEAARMMARAGVSGLVSFGLAGGLAPGLASGAVIIPDTAICADGRELQIHAVWQAALRVVLSDSGLRIVKGRQAASDTVLDSADAKRELRDKTGADAVDMESHGVGIAAEELGLPFLILRAIADPAEKGLPPSASAAMGPRGQVRILPVIAGLMRRPRDLGELIRLAGESRCAGAALRRVCLLAMPRLGLGG